MDSVDFLGYLGSLLVFSTFYLKRMTRLRSVAIASNVAFIAYGYFGGLWPVLLLHTMMLPLNIWRLLELRRQAEVQSSRRPRRASCPAPCRRFIRTAKTGSPHLPTQMHVRMA